jgi:hypothetical protein
MSSGSSPLTLILFPPPRRSLLDSARSRPGNQTEWRGSCLQFDVEWGEGGGEEFVGGLGGVGVCGGLFGLCGGFWGVWR